MAGAIFGDVRESTSVVPRIVNNVSYVSRINHESHFVLQVQYLVKLHSHFLWQVQHLVIFGMIAGARNVVFFTECTSLYTAPATQNDPHD